VKEFSRVGGIVCRWVMAALAGWWFISFLALIGQSSGRSQELAGMAFGKAIICGVAAAIWFYRAGKAKKVQKPADYSVKARQSVVPVQPKVPPPPAATGEEQVISAPGPHLDSPPSKLEEPSEPNDFMSARGWIFISGVFAVLAGVIVFVAISNQIGKSKPKNPPVDLSDIWGPNTNGSGSNRSVASVAHCPAGLPAGVEIVPIDDLTTVTASDGQLWHEPVGDREAWHLSFKVLNQTAVSSSGRTFEGYCIARFALVVSVQGEDGNTYDIPGRQYLTSPYVYLSPGWSQEVKDLYLGLYRVPHNGSLSSWKITKAWGFPLNSRGETPTYDENGFQIVKDQKDDPFAAYGGHLITPSNPKNDPAAKVDIPKDVASGRLLQKTEPLYPPIAKAARVSGTVVLQATISKTGSIKALSVLSGPDMLKQASIDAVKTWKYKPYIVNNQPVEVVTTVNVIFALGD
jgi:TonB family protein